MTTVTVQNPAGVDYQSYIDAFTSVNAFDVAFAPITNGTTITLNLGSGRSVIFTGVFTGSQVLNGAGPVTQVQFLLNGVPDVTATGMTFTLQDLINGVLAGDDALLDVLFGEVYLYTGNDGADVFVSGYLDDTISGLGGDDSLNGGYGNDTMTGGTGNDTLIGSFGNDAMTGGIGDDTYYVDAFSDQTVEQLDGGIDTIISSISRTLAAHVENLTLTGTAALAGNGNALANLITGNSGNNALRGNDGDDTLDGGAGIDIMFGGIGNDTYFVDAYSDQTNETASAGTDSVISSISRTLAINVENLTLTGTGNLAGNGNALANFITGNSGNNALRGFDGDDTIDGGAGNDIMFGGIGNDTYYVDASTDQTNETLGAGTDLVISSISRSLSVNVENLTLTGSAALAGNGNALGNVLTGNTGSNILRGYDGNDVLIGGAGVDNLLPGSDTLRDVIKFNAVTESTGSQRDTVTGMDLDAEDVFDFTVTPGSIAFVNTGTLNLATINSDLATAVNAALAPGGAVLFDPSGGTLNTAGHAFLVVDANNDGVYAPNQDYVVQLVNATGTLTSDDFI